MKLLNTFAFVTTSSSPAAAARRATPPAAAFTPEPASTAAARRPCRSMAPRRRPTRRVTRTPRPAVRRARALRAKVCCQGTTGSTCIAEGATCKGLAAQCTNTATCSAATAGQVCCGTLSIASQSATSVRQAGPCPSGEYELCTQFDGVHRRPRASRSCSTASRSRSPPARTWLTAGLGRQRHVDHRRQRRRPDSLAFRLRAVSSEDCERQWMRVTCHPHG